MTTRKFTEMSELVAILTENEEPSNSDELWEEFERQNIRRSPRIGRFIAELQRELDKPDFSIDYVETKQGVMAEMQDIALQYPTLKALMPYDGLWYQDIAGFWHTADETEMEGYKAIFESYKSLYENVSLSDLGKTGRKSGMPMATTPALAYISYAYHTRNEVTQLLDNLKGVNGVWKTYANPPATA